MYKPELTQVQKAHLGFLCSRLTGGKFEQTRDRLHRKNDGYCCLGVACELSYLGYWAYRHQDEEFPAYILRGETYSSEPDLRTSLPVPVAEHFGLPPTVPGAIAGRNFFNKSFHGADRTSVPVPLSIIEQFVSYDIARTIQIRGPEISDDEGNFFLHLTTVNDSGATFPQIAAILRAWLLDWEYTEEEKKEIREA